MHELVRADAPPCLSAQAPGWTETFVQARQVNEAVRFRWPSDPCYQAIRATLLTMSVHHCAFCDGLLGRTSRETVEHFQPKAAFPQCAYDWGNLYPCCDVCPDLMISHTPIGGNHLGNERDEHETKSL